MRKIPLSYGLVTYLDDLEYTEAGLAADPDASSLAEPFKEAIEEWETFFKKERSARREVTRAEAVVAVRNERLDVLTTRFAAAARGLAVEMVGKLFGDTTPGQFVRKGLRAQCEKTRDVILPELGKLDEAHGLKPFAAQLDAGVGGALSALDGRAKAKGSRQVVANDTDEWKEGVNALRTTTYAELLKIATANKYPKSWVESFFRQAQTAAGDSEGDAPEAAPIPEPS
jgi:hypothetical protein